MKLNTLPVKVVGILVVIGLSCWLANVALSTAEPVNAFEIFAASHVEGDKAEVRLRWIMKTGWLPQGGFNLFRTDAEGKEVLLNATILGANPGNIADKDSPWKSPPEPKGKQGRSKVKKQYSYAEAVQIVRVNQDKLSAANFSLQPGKRLPASVSEKAFLALKQQRQAFYHPPEKPMKQKARNMTEAIAAERADFPDLSSYYDLIGRGNLALPTVKRAVVKDVEETSVGLLRNQLVVGALLHPNTIGSDLGLAFTDTNVELGKKYHYTLKVVDKANPAKQTTVAERDIIVQQDQPPAAPTGLTGFQYDASTVCLRWNRIAPTPDSGLLSYHIFRIDKANPEPGKQLDHLPVVIRDLPIRALKKGDDATHVEPMVLFHDTQAGSAAPGEVTYKLAAVDAFGRRSSPASTKVTLEDLLTPPAVNHLAAERFAKTGKTQIIWTAIDQPDVLYTICRIDQETQQVEKLIENGTGQALPALLPDYPNLDAIVHPKARSTKGKQPDPPKAPAVSQFTWLAFTDTPPEDHYFAYRITASYKGHPRSSQPQDSPTIAVPSLKTPPAPAIEAAFVPANKLPKATAGSSTPKTGKRSVLRSAEYLAEKPANLAGAVQLEWKAVPDAHSYRIYRANGTGFGPAGSDATSDAKTPLLPIGEKGKVRYHAEIPESDLKTSQFSLVGQVNDKTEFLDYVARSPAHVYWYRIVAVNRWGIPGAGETAQYWSKPAKVRVPATLPPATPTLISALPDTAGNIVLALSPPALLDGKVIYHIYRCETKYQGGAPVVVSKIYKEVLKGPGDRKQDQIVFTDKLVQSSYVYDYYAIADNDETPPVFSAASNKLGASTFKASVIAPSQVEAVLKEGEFLIQWKGVANATGYIVERAAGGPTAEFAQISDLLGKTSFVDRNPESKSPICTYRVIAVDSSGNISNPSDYPLDQQQKDPSKYPAQKTITMKRL